MSDFQLFGIFIILAIAASLGGSILFGRLARGSGDIGTLSAHVNRGRGLWLATQPGSCCTCGHEWLPGEIIGTVVQAYELCDDGAVVRRPGARKACGACVEWQRREGDLSLRWARDAGLLP